MTQIRLIRHQVDGVNKFSFHKVHFNDNLEPSYYEPEKMDIEEDFVGDIKHRLSLFRRASELPVFCGGSDFPKVL